MKKLIFILCYLCLFMISGCKLGMNGQKRGDGMEWRSKTFAAAVAEAMEKEQITIQDLAAITKIEVVHSAKTSSLILSAQNTKYECRYDMKYAFRDLSDLVYFENLSTLLLFSENIEGLEVCNELPQLVEIHLRSNTSEQLLKSVSKLQYIRVLKVQFLNLDYAMLSEMPNLEILKITNYNFRNYIEPSNTQALMTLPKQDILLDFEELSGMNNYELASQYPNILKIGRIYIPEGGDITFLEKMDQLEKVDLIGVTDIGPISKMVWLKDLSIQMTKGVSDFSSLAQLTQLERLFLKTDLDQDFSLHNIGAMKSLKELDLEGNCIYSLDGIERFEGLKSFICSGGLVEDITALRALGNNMEYLDLHGNIITDVSALNSFKNLQYLDLSYNEIYEVSPLKECVSLRYLDLYENPIRNISPIAGLPALEELFLFHNQVRTETINITQWRHTLLSFPKLKFYSGLESEWIYENSSQVRAKSIYD